MGADRSRPVELVVGPLVRHVLIRESADSWLLCLRYHHVVVDGLGHTVHVRRIAAVYPALTAGVEPRPHDLVAEDAAYPDTPAFARDRAYWLERFADRPAPVSLGDRHTGTPAHRHTGTPAHRHTGTPARQAGCCAAPPISRRPTPHCYRTQPGGWRARPSTLFVAAVAASQGRLTAQQ